MFPIIKNQLLEKENIYRINGIKIIRISLFFFTKTALESLDKPPAMPMFCLSLVKTYRPIKHNYINNKTLEMKIVSIYFRNLPAPCQCHGQFEFGSNMFNNCLDSAHSTSSQGIGIWTPNAHHICP